MKPKRIIPAAVLLISTLAFSQEGTIIPLSHGTEAEVLSGTYEKDMANAYAPYIGNWETTWQGKKLSISIEKITKHLKTYPNGDYYYRDELIMKYRVVEIATQNILVDTFADLPEEAKITSTSAGLGDQMYFLYIDRDLCLNSGEIRLQRNLGNLDELTYMYQYDNFWNPQDCVYMSQEDIPIPIPTETVVLTKIN